MSRSIPRQSNRKPATHSITGRDSQKTGSRAVVECLECAVGGVDSALNLRRRVRRTKKRRFKLRGWKVDPALEHAAMELCEGRCVRLHGILIVRDSVTAEEQGKHRAHSSAR